jgi:hypothetical protein
MAAQLLSNNLAIAFQSFSPLGHITFDFAILIDSYPVKKRKFIAYVGNYPAISTSGYLDKQQADYLSLLSGNALDSRSIPQNLTLVATSTRSIKINWYRRNKLESHPRLLASLDWVEREIEIKKGKQYVLFLPDIVLGTLMVDAATKAEILAAVLPSNNYPSRYLFAGNLPELFDYWNALYPVPPPVANPYPLASTVTLTSDSGIDDPPMIVKVVESSSAPVIRVMAANNDRWGHGTLTIAKNRPPNNHPIFQFDHQKLFEELQPDGSYGTYMTDSPRIQEIWAALGAGTYATYIDENGQQLPRVANLGWLIDKMSNILGLRRKPSGKYLDKVDQAKYDRNRLNSPKWAQGDYDLNSWGNKGYALRHLPTSYENGQRQDNQYDLVHDLPQLLAAVLDQIDLGQGLQHTAEIRMKVGKEVQSYPNVGQLTIDLAARVIELEALVEKMAVMQIETSNSVRELFPGIGIPVATKSVSIDIGGKQQQIFYPGFQAGKGSILDSLSAIKVNLGIVLGQLMPQKKPDSRWNPFDRKPKS